MTNHRYFQAAEVVRGTMLTLVLCARAGFVLAQESPKPDPDADRRETEARRLAEQRELELVETAAEHEWARAIRPDITKAPKGPGYDVWLTAQELCNADLKILTGLRQIRGLDLSGGLIGDEGMEHVSKMQGLDALRLLYTAVTDEGIGRLASLRKLEWLDVDGSPKEAITQKAFKALQRSPRLRWVEFGRVDGVELRLVEGFRSLEHLKITDCNVQRLIVKDLPKLRKLTATTSTVTKLRLENLPALEEIQFGGETHASDCPLAKFNCKRLPRLKSIYISAPLKEPDLDQLHEAPHLQSLEIRSTNLSSAAFRRMAPLKDLEELNLQVVEDFDEEDLQHLSALTKLRVLDLSNNDMTGRGLRHLVPLQDLRKLQLGSNKLTNDSLRDVGRLSKLRTLDLVFNDTIGDAGIAFLKDLGSLQELNLGATAVTDEALKSVASLTELTSLSLTDTRVTDVGLKHLRPLTKLTTLDLAKTKLTNRGIREIAQLKDLEMLDLCGTFISDEGIEPLFGLRRLWLLSTHDTSVTKAALDRFSNRPEFSRQ